MLDDKTVTDKNIEDKSVQEVMAEAKKGLLPMWGRITSKQIPYGDQTKW